MEKILNIKIYENLRFFQHIIHQISFQGKHEYNCVYERKEGGFYVVDRFSYKIE